VACLSGATPPLAKNAGNLACSPPSKMGEDSYEACLVSTRGLSAGSCFIDRPYCAASPEASPRACPALGLATKERHTKTCALYPRSQERSLTAHLVKARHLRNLKTMPGVLSADLLPQGRGLLQAALSSQVNRPHHLAREAQSDGVLIVAPFPAVRHLSPHGDLIEHRSDFREFPRLPGMIGDDTCAVSAHIIRVGQLGSVTVLRPGQVHNHCDRQPFFHFVAKVVEDFRNTPVSAGAFGYRARGLNPRARSNGNLPLSVSMTGMGCQSKRNPERSSGELPKGVPFRTKQRHRKVLTSANGER